MDENKDLKSRPTDVGKPGGDKIKEKIKEGIKDKIAKKELKGSKDKRRNVRQVKSVQGQRVLAFKHRTVVFPLNVSTDLREEEFHSRVFKDNAEFFKEIL